jgi:hypothetical protein
MLPSLVTVRNSLRRMSIKDLLRTPGDRLLTVSYKLAREQLCSIEVLECESGADIGVTIVIAYVSQEDKS